MGWHHCSGLITWIKMPMSPQRYHNQPGARQESSGSYYDPIGIVEHVQKQYSVGHAAIAGLVKLIKPSEASLSSVQEILDEFERSTVEIKNVAEESEVLLSRDPVTGIHNRGSFWRIAEQTIDGLDANDGVVVATIDLNAFKPVNDQYGHPAGDVVLREVATRLDKIVEKRGFAGRMGGDELTAICHSNNIPGKDTV